MSTPYQDDTTTFWTTFAPSVLGGWFESAASQINDDEEDEE